MQLVPCLPRVSDFVLLIQSVVCKKLKLTSAKNCPPISVALVEVCSRTQVRFRPLDRSCVRLSKPG